MEEKIHGIRFRTIIEILGKPKEHIEKTIRGYIEKIREDNEFILLKESFAESTQHENLWSTFAELEIVCKDISKLIGFCFEYMPSSIEVIKPEHLTMSNPELSNFLNDLQARLHNVDMIVKRLKAENDFLKLNMDAILHNAIMMCLKVSKLTLEQLSQITGVEKKELEIFVENLLKENKIKKDGEQYTLV